MKTDPRTAAETLQPMKMLQGVLIANQFDNFIYQQGLALSKLANANGPSNLIPATREHPANEDVNRYIPLDDHDSLRVLTHVLLIFISLGLDLGGAYRQTVVENVIVSYISFLRLAGKEEVHTLVLFPTFWKQKIRHAQQESYRCHRSRATSHADKIDERVRSGRPRIC